MIVILDFGSQTCELIARRVRELEVYSEVLSYDIPASVIKEKGAEGIILSGGPSSCYEEGSPLPDPEIFKLGIPILGICYGMQLSQQMLGGKVEADGSTREYGKARFKANTKSLLFTGLLEDFVAWMSHGDSVTKLAPGFEVIGTTESLKNAAVENKKLNFYGLQFHPEVSHTEQGRDIVRNFVFVICKAKAVWTMKDYLKKAITDVQKTVGNKKVLLGLSGGVDSTTVAALLHKAIGPNLICMFINQGFMRKGECERIITMIEKYFSINLVYVDASKRFFDKLKGVTDPEEKRKIIGTEFVRTFEEESKKIGHFDYLAQGTLYPDVIESAAKPSKHNNKWYVSKAAVKIKSHHNVGGLPDDMKFELIEPLRMLFKDEVRKLGRELNMHDEIIYRQPFPGPGLAIRILGEVTPERVATLQDADKIVMDEIRAADLYRKVWQSFAVLLPIKSVGVMGDQRTYENAIAVRSVTSDDAMTAKWSHLPYEVLEKISSRIINEVAGINRVVYDISSKPPATIEWE